MKPYALPALSLRFVPVWRRNFLVWRKLAVPSILGNLADPMIYMLGLGYGLGALLPDIGGVSYVAFLAAGTVCFSTTNSATFETLYSAFSRMHVQRTWEAIMNAPVELDDVLLAELVWAASKAFLSGLAIMVVVWTLGLSNSPLSVCVLAIVPLIGLCFGAQVLAKALGGEVNRLDRTFRGYVDCTSSLASEVSFEGSGWCGTTMRSLRRPGPRSSPGSPTPTSPFASVMPGARNLI